MSPTQTLLRCIAFAIIFVAQAKCKSTSSPLFQRHAPSCDPLVSDHSLNHPTDCNKYYRCTFGSTTAVESTCPPNWLFHMTYLQCVIYDPQYDDITLICNQPNPITPTGTPGTPTPAPTTTPTTTPLPPGACPSVGEANLPHPSDCTKYFWCLDGNVQATKDCLTGWGFDVTSSSCLPLTSGTPVTCGPGATLPPVTSSPVYPSSPPTTTPTPTTPNPNPTTPSTNATTPNPNPTTPDPNPTTPDPNPTTPNPNPTTPNPNPTTPSTNPTTPSTNPTTPSTNPTTPTTVSPNATTSTTIPPVTSTPVTTTALPDKICPEFGSAIVPHPTDCSKYLSCLGGVATEHACQCAQLFNQPTLQCVAYDSAQCFPGSTKPAKPTTCGSNSVSSYMLNISSLLTALILIQQLL